MTSPPPAPPHPVVPETEGEAEGDEKSEKSEGAEDEDGDDSQADEESDDESTAGDAEWTIGFVEPAPASDLARQFFPSKVGGRPAWLHPVDVPTAAQLKCLYTREPLDFLMQVYAPVDDEPSAFHRALYVFVSPHGGDLHRPGAVRVFRSQLPRCNPFYPDEPAERGGPLQELSDAQQAAYDARGDRWADRRTDVGAQVRKPRTFAENELVVEPEEFDDEEGEALLRGAKELGKEEAKAILADAAEGQLPEGLREKGADVTGKDMRVLERMQDKNQVQLSRFHLRLRRSDPEQVVRYCFDEGAKPLWPSVSDAPEHTDKTVPPCPRCGAARRFEFQVLPQIINHLNVDSELASAVDFGSIAVYTCGASCALGGLEGDGAVGVGAGGLSEAYAEEVALVHPPLNA